MAGRSLAQPAFLGSEGRGGMSDNVIPNLNMLDFVFERDRHSEIEAGYVLAGVLVIDFPKPKRRHLSGRAQKMANTIILYLSRMAEAGQLRHDAIVYGWKNGLKPPNADDITKNEAVMKAWVEKRAWIGVRASKDGRWRTSEILTPDSPRWDEFCDGLLRMIGDPPGCAHDHRSAKTVMRKMGNVDIEGTLAYCEAHGGYCDCEILLNADPACRIFGDDDPGEGARH